jgi:hypothetical protein
MNLRAMLDELHELSCAIDAARLDRDTMIDAVMTPEQRAQVQEIKEEYNPRITAAEQRHAELEMIVRDAVREGNESVKGEHIAALVIKPRVTWDTEGLLTMASKPGNAWVLEFVRLGQPTVQIRRR